MELNYWTQLSVDCAQTKNYLDQLYSVYPIVENPPDRPLDIDKKNLLQELYDSRDNERLIKELLSLQKFPIKNSYASYLKNDHSAISRNPDTINRLAGCFFQMGFDKMIAGCETPIEPNRQMGPMFKNWVQSGVLGAKVTANENEFLSYSDNCIFNASDEEMNEFAKKFLGYQRDKGVDFLARFRGKYCIGEAKFLTDFGGHQNAQFSDAIGMFNEGTFKNVNKEVIPIAIMDGVLYIKNEAKFYKYIMEHPDHKIISALYLRDFLYSIV